MRIAAVTLLFGALAIAACDDDNVVLPDIEARTFVLRSANGQSLPAILGDSIGGRPRLELLAGRLTLELDGTFTDDLDFRQREESSTITRRRFCQGIFFTSGNTATFAEAVAATDESCGESFTGVLGLESLTATIQGIELVWSPAP